jgi:peptidoglycan/xylan/chitin deacetylase (PgdA/CDA1 family)
MDELDRRKLKAVFFVMGQHIVRNRPEDLARRDLLRKLALHGHHVGNHTMNHKDLCQNPGSLAEEVDHAAELITTPRACGRCSFARPTAPAAARWIGRWQSAT